MGCQPSPQRRDPKNQSGECEKALSSTEVAQASRSHCPDKAADQCATHCPAFKRGRFKLEVSLIERLCTANDYPVIAEEQTSKRARRSHQPYICRAREETTVRICF